jgi:hypothetical protein
MKKRSFSKKLLKLMVASVADLEVVASKNFQPKSFECGVVAVLKAIVVYQQERRREARHKK